MSSTSKLDATLDTTWRAATGAGSPSVAIDRAVAPGKPVKRVGPVFYTQPSGADLFPSLALLKAFFRKLRRA